MKKKNCKTINVLIIVLLISLITSCNKNDLDKGNNGSNNLVTNYDGFSDFEIIQNVIKKLKEVEFHMSGEGETTAKLGFISYKQHTVTSLHHIDNSYVSDVSSKSLFVNQTHTYLFKNEKVKYIDSSDSKLNEVEKNEYIEKFGVLAGDESVFNYIINQETIISSKRKKENVLIVTYNFDTLKAPVNLKKQMKLFGGLNDYPKFTSIELTLYIENDFKLLSYSTKESYSINKSGLGNLNCTQNITVNLKYEDIKKPDLTKFK